MRNQSLFGYSYSGVLLVCPSVRGPSHCVRRLLRSLITHSPPPLGMSARMYCPSVVTAISVVPSSPKAQSARPSPMRS